MVSCYTIMFMLIRYAERYEYKQRSRSFYFYTVRAQENGGNKNQQVYLLLHLLHSLYSQIRFSFINSQYSYTPATSSVVTGEDLVLPKNYCQARQSWGKDRNHCKEQLDERPNGCVSAARGRHLGNGPYENCKFWAIRSQSS